MIQDERSSSGRRSNCCRDSAGEDKCPEHSGRAADQEAERVMIGPSFAVVVVFAGWILIATLSETDDGGAALDAALWENEGELRRQMQMMECRVEMECE